MGKALSSPRIFEAAVALSGVAAFVVVLFLRDFLAGLPGVMVAGSLVLFMAPGVLLARWFLADYFSGVALVPAGFAISCGGFALLAVPMPVAQASLGVYLWACGAVVAAPQRRTLAPCARGAANSSGEPAVVRMRAQVSRRAVGAGHCAPAV